MRNHTREEAVIVHAMPGGKAMVLFFFFFVLKYSSDSK